jgi:leucyl aminopeptidase (aminopeptidase T)
LNESAAHVDMLVDTREDSRLEFDGEVVREDGEFWFE